MNTGHAFQNKIKKNQSDQIPCHEKLPLLLQLQQNLIDTSEFDFRRVLYLPVNRKFVDVERATPEQRKEKSPR